MPVADSPGLHIAALIIALTIITILHMTIGEQAPKIYAIRKPETISLACAYPLYIFTLVLRPSIWLINGISNALLRLVGMNPHHDEGESHDVEELRSILRGASRAGNITGRQLALSENILSLVRLDVRHIMLPRIDVTFLTTEKDLAASLEDIRASRHTRFPLCDPDLDHIVGMVHGKDVLAHFIAGTAIDLRALARAMPTVTDTQSVSRYIMESQRGQHQCACVVDEHGTTVGMIFLEDALEEIVGPLRDEFDSESPRVSESTDGTIEMAGSVPLPEAASILELKLGEDEDTVGGFVTDKLGRLPKEGDTVDVGKYRVTILSMAKRRVARLRFAPIKGPPP
jgi:CBS domain containing-hemolysin-like protein